MGGTPVVGVDTDTDDLAAAYEADGEVEEFVDPDCKELFPFRGNRMRFKVEKKRGDNLPLDRK